MDDAPLPQPNDDDEQLALHFLRMREDNDLRVVADGEGGCAACFHYMDPSEPMSYCWQPAVRIGVGATWRCRWWRPTPDD